MACAKGKQAVADNIITVEDELLKESAVSASDTARLIEHQERLFEGIYDSLRLDMIASQQPDRGLPNSSADLLRNGYVHTVINVQRTSCFTLRLRVHSQDNTGGRSLPRMM